MAKSAPAPKAAKAAPAPKAAKAEKAAVVKVEKAPRPQLESQNDVTRPADGTKTGAVWSIADRLSKQFKRPATRGEVMEQAKAEDINEATVATQYQRWRVFNGVPKATPVVKEAKAPKAPKAPKAAATA